MDSLFSFFADGSHIFHRLNELSGTLGQRYAAVSAVMSEALRFKRCSLYLLLRDWRSWLLRDDSLPTLVGLDQVRSSRFPKSTELPLNGWC